MIINLGVDVFLFKRFFNRKNFFLDEKKNINLKFKKLYLAKIFSVKESFVKSLGTGFREGFFLNNLIINNNLLKKPSVFKKNENLKILLSISHEKNSIITIVIILSY